MHKGARQNKFESTFEFGNDRMKMCFKQNTKMKVVYII
jgi:hypothetical protein